MNYKETLKEIENALEKLKTHVAWEVDTEALKVAKKALEIQIPKKPEIIEDKMWVCPSCNNNLLWLYEKYPEKKTELNKGLPFCLNCGQAIDWEVKE